MMNYKLAKKLKDAGFPQSPKNKEVWTYQFENMDEETGECVRIPTLSELIEACGEGIGTIWKSPVDHKWHACTMVESNHLESDGYKYPEEAVANLWLKLNEQEI